MRALKTALCVWVVTAYLLGVIAGSSFYRQQHPSGLWVLCHFALIPAVLLILVLGTFAAERFRRECRRILENKP